MAPVPKRRSTNRSGAAPTTELGVETQFSLFMGNGGKVAPWSMFIDEREYVPELTWPNSVMVYDRMRADSQIEGLYFGLIMPIKRYNWLIDPNGARPEIVSGIATDLNLNIKDQQPEPKGRHRGRFDFFAHMSDALLAILYGHYGFEQVGYIGDDGLWHLKKLAPREPRTIQQINVASDGGLVSVKQAIARNIMGDYPEIPVDRLVWYPWQKEGANWVGRSMLRPLYRNWLLKDKLLRIDVINHERAGGVPYVISGPGATPDEIKDNAKLAQQFRVSDAGGGSLPYGSDLKLARAGGTDIINSIRYHDEQMARRFLMMLMQLGQTQTGSRNLGETFWDFFQLGQEAVANWFMTIFNEHVIEDWVDWNYGEQEENVPLLTWERTNENQSLSIEELVALIDSGAIVVDRDLEDQLRDRYNLTNKMAGAPDPGELQQKLLEAPPAADNPPEPKPSPTRTGANATAGVRAKQGVRGTEGFGSLRPDDGPAPRRFWRRRK